MQWIIVSATFALLLRLVAMQRCLPLNEISKCYNLCARIQVKDYVRNWLNHIFSYVSPRGS